MIDPGFYFGTCTNTTVNVTARIALALAAQDKDLVPGTLGIYGELGGGGDFLATKTGNKICFTTHEPEHKISIVWQGTLQDGNIEGTYSVTASGIMMRIMGLGRQVGSWKCDLAREFKPTAVQVSESARIWVRSQNGTEGPLLLPDFIELLIKDRWDHNADVSIDGQASWLPIGLIVEQLARADPPEARAGEFWPDVGKDVAKKVVTGFAASVILGIFGINAD
jgi:hypothetical protein